MKFQILGQVLTHAWRGRSAGGCNFATLFPIWDVVFGTADFESEASAAGVADGRESAFRSISKLNSLNRWGFDTVMIRFCRPPETTEFLQYGLSVLFFKVSISNGHAISVDRWPLTRQNAEHWFDQIRAVPFVRHLRLVPAKSGDRNASSVLEITTPRGKHCLPLIVKRSYLDRSMVNAVIGQIQGERKAAKGGGRIITNGETLVLAPYLATPTAKSFIDAGIL